LKGASSRLSTTTTNFEYFRSRSRTRTRKRVCCSRKSVGRPEMRRGTNASCLLRVERSEFLPAPPSPKVPIACASCSSAARQLSSFRAPGGGDDRTMLRGEAVTLGDQGVRWLENWEMREVRGLLQREKRSLSSMQHGTACRSCADYGGMAHTSTRRNGRNAPSAARHVPHHTHDLPWLTDLLLLVSQGRQGHLSMGNG